MSSAEIRRFCEPFITCYDVYMDRMLKEDFFKGQEQHLNGQRVLKFHLSEDRKPQSIPERDSMLLLGFMVAMVGLLCIN